MENDFVSAVAARIDGKNEKKQIAAELESHILDKAEYYQELGYDEETALEKATEDMGKHIRTTANVPIYQNLFIQDKAILRKDDRL